ncbi:hypothetical protein AKJ56_01490 [candidate division MSBL1 archaeon SCGC-AAA382N08]|uniref:Helicase ATP-binding domain-containing protein n=1 Tax=candidate division MSBL1 archaeon SCGC-AAA382N08 TaxID=1698285 RepID=A0A133VPN0_9EURY|nr:hypothetical protein AKJ56_01490 [candidate division MSBL1 archaeon SCGC-AAA382N08]
MKEKLFPYSFRSQQKELLEKIHDEIWNSNLCIHAATGFGKTPVILSGLLPYTEDYKVLWSVRTGNETDRPIEELKVINNQSSENFFGISYRGKRDMCLLAKEKELGGAPSYSDVSFLCRDQGDDCTYRKNLKGVNPESVTDDPLLYSEILEMSKNLEVCPYYLQRDLVPLADVISLSYNYIIDESLGWVIKKLVPFQECFLVMDEAHNLQKAASSLNSDQITLRTLTRSLNEIELLGEENPEKLLELLKLFQNEMKKSGRGVEEESELDMKEFLHSLIKNWGKDPLDFRLDLEEMVSYGIKIRRKHLENGEKPRSSLHHLGRFWLNVLDNLDVDGIVFLVKRERDTIAFESWDMRTAEILRDRWKKFKGCVFCSGTLKPIRAFATVAGLEKVKSCSIGSFYNSDKIVSFIPSGLTTKGKELGGEMARRYVDSIVKFSKEIDSNVATFSASYRIQNRLIEEGLKEKIEKDGRKFYQERRGMDGNLARRILEDFKRDSRNGNGQGFLCATATGRFAEGADFPGEELEGIFLVGIPFDRMSLRTELYLDFYKETYGDKKGMYYGYIVPALRRASQALGRVLRSRNDRGIFVCGDERYGDRRFFRLLPDFIRNNTKPSNFGRIGKDVRCWAEEILNKKE